jgi:hypothetical protein
MVEMKVEALRMSLMTPGQQVVILKDVATERYLPIFIGKPEGDAILLVLREDEPPRPFTHDLFLILLDSLQGKLNHALINDLRNSHYHAQLALEVRGNEVFVDARPSDAIAIALRARCPIYVDNDVMEAVAVRPPADDMVDGNLGAFEDFLDSLDLDDWDKDKGPDR